MINLIFEKRGETRLWIYPDFWFIKVIRCRGHIVHINGLQFSDTSFFNKFYWDIFII
jgi:hypothetical protein